MTDGFSVYLNGLSKGSQLNSVGFSGTPKDMGPPYGKRDPYYSHTTPIRIPKDMGMVWKAYHKGVPLLGVRAITLDRLGVEH